MSDVNILNFKVFVWNGKDWDFVSRFPAANEEDARSLARELEQTEKKQVKILCEAYETASKSFVTRVLYVSPKPASAAPALSVHKKTTVVRALPKVFLVVITALSGALVLSRFGAQILSYVDSDIVSQQGISDFSFSIFLFAFIFVAFWLGVKYLPAIISPRRSAADRDDSENAENGGENEQQKQSSAFMRKFSRRIHGFVNGICTPMDKETYEAQKAKDLDAIDSVLREQKKNEKTYDMPELMGEASAAETAPAAPQNGEAAAETPVRADKKDLSRNLAEFQDLVLHTAARYADKMSDAYFQFGVRLILAGGLLRLADAFEFSEGEKMDAFYAMFSEMNVSAFMTEVFYEKLFDYSQDEACRPLLETGGEMLSKFREDPASIEIPLTIQKVLTDWMANGPDSQQEKIQASSFFVVMFTDIVGSTGITQSLGDRSAQQLIHVHNTIVRQALAEYAGREVKMTGDGIMASFTSVGSAIDAAIGIQKAIKFYNSQKKSSPLYLRIGLNAGEPIVEGNDLFGTVVQIAARVCNLAEKNEIYVSRLVEELAVGKPYNFIDKGLQQLKGISQKQQVYEVAWDS